MDRITKEALNQDNILAKQYRENDPLFPNSGRGMRKAASDIKEVKSLAGNHLLTNQWHLTVLSPYHPNIRDEEGGFVLLEKRSLFGDRVVYKFNMKGNPLQREVHPEDTPDLREELFGRLDPSVSYIKQSVSLEDAQAEALLKDIYDKSSEEDEGESKDDGQGDGFRKEVESLLSKEKVEDDIIDLITLLDIDRESREAISIKNMITLAWARVHDDETIKKGLHELKLKDPYLHKYAKTFYWIVADFFESYRVASTSVLQGNTQGELTKKEKWGTKITKGILSMGKAIPVFGKVAKGLESVIDNVAGLVTEKRYNIKISNMSRIIRRKCETTDEITRHIMGAALKIAKNKKKEIKALLKPVQKELSKIGKAKKWFNKQIDAISRKVLPDIEIEDPNDRVAQQALKDATLTLAYLVKNHEEVTGSTTPLEDQIVDIGASLNVFLENQMDPTGNKPTPIDKEKKKKSRACTIQ